MQNEIDETLSLDSLDSYDSVINSEDNATVEDEVGLLGQHTQQLFIVEDESKKSGLWMAFMNMANSILGAGIIGQAYAVKQAGLVGGILLLIILSFVIDWTIRMMVTNSKLSGMKTYQSTVKFCFGNVGMILISLAQFLFAYGGCLAFCVIIGDTIPHVLRALFPKAIEHGASRFFTGRLAAIVFTVMGVSYPLSLNRNIASLARASMLALVSMALITLTVAIRGPQIAPKDAKFNLRLLTVNTNFFQAVSIISFAFVCHHNTLLIYNSLKRPTLNRFAKVVHYSVGISTLCCLLLGLTGFLSFKDLTESNVLNNFGSNDLVANIARFCFGFNMVTTLPLEIFVCRSVFAEYLFHEEMPTKYHFLVTTVLVASVCGLSLTTCDLGVILELVGASAACTMAYILPQMCFLKLSDKPKRHIQKLMCYACILFGFIVMIVSTIMTLHHVHHTDNTPCDPW